MWNQLYHRWGWVRFVEHLFEKFIDFFQTPVQVHFNRSFKYWLTHLQSNYQSKKKKQIFWSIKFIHPVFWTISVFELKTIEQKFFYHYMFNSLKTVRRSVVSLEHCSIWIIHIVYYSISSTLEHILYSL